MAHMENIANLESIKVGIQAVSFRTAKLSEFRTSMPKLLFGERLKEIINLETSIAQQGLMRPLNVTHSGDKLIVIDGRKRLCALRRMRFKNTLPRSLVNIPFVMSADIVPHVLSAQDQYRSVIEMKAKDQTDETIIASLCISPARLHALQSINRLSPHLKNAFLNQTISIEQASAFAALPWHEAQEALLLSIGPFATAEKILKIIAMRKARLTSSERPQVSAEVITMSTPPLRGLSPIIYKVKNLAAA